MFESARLFWLNVSRAASTTIRKVWKPASDELDVEGELVRSFGEVDTLARDLLAIRVQAEVRRLGDARRDRGDRLDRLPKARNRWRLQPLDQDLVATLEAHDPRLDLDAPRCRQGGLLLPAAGRVVAVGDQDDPLLHLVGEERGCQAEGPADIGRGRHRRRAQPVDLPYLLWQALHEGIATECHDPGRVPGRHVCQAFPEERQGRLMTSAADRVREVDHEYGRQPVDGQHELEPGEGEDEGGEEDGPNRERDTMPPHAGPPASGEVRYERDDERRHQQEQPQRALEADAHHVPPPGATRFRNPRQSRSTASRW